MKPKSPKTESRITYKVIIGERSYGFIDPDDAKAFAERFGGKAYRIRTTQTVEEVK